VIAFPFFGQPKEKRNFGLGQSDTTGIQQSWDYWEEKKLNQGCINHISDIF